jgi:hypothetical protein
MMDHSVGRPWVAYAQVLTAVVRTALARTGFDSESPTAGWAVGQMAVRSLNCIHLLVGLMVADKDCSDQMAYCMDYQMVHRMGCRDQKVGQEEGQEEHYTGCGTVHQDS